MKTLKFVGISCILLLMTVSSLFSAESATLTTDALSIELRPQHNFPKVGKYEILSCDFHMHTPFSDGRISPRERILEAYRQGYDAIAITDHMNTNAYKDAIDLANSLGIILIRGFETSLESKEHLVVLNMPEGYKPVVLKEQKSKSSDFYQDQLREISKKGGLVFYPHPHVGYREPIMWAVKHGLISGIEVKNGVVGKGWNTVLSHGVYCYPSAFDFALQNNLAILSNSDSHTAKTSASEISYVLVKKRSVEGVIEAIRAGRTVAGFDGMIWGNKNLLTDIFKVGVKISRTGDGIIRIHNQLPIVLKARLDSDNSAVEIKPYGEVLLPTDGAQYLKPIVFENIWINLKDNLGLQ